MATGIRPLAWGRAIFTGLFTERRSKCGNYIIESVSHYTRGVAPYTTFAVRRGDGSFVEPKPGKRFCYDLNSAKAWAQEDYGAA